MRNTLVASAAEGARYGANADRDPATGAAVTRPLIRDSLADSFADGVTSGFETVDGMQTVYVQVEATLPVLGLLGPPRASRCADTRSRRRRDLRAVRACAPAPAGPRADRDDGNAIVEFVYLAVLLMVPLVYVLLTVFRVQAASYAVSSAAREAGRVYATADDLDTAGPRAFAAANLVMGDSDMSLRPDQVEISCSQHAVPAAGLAGERGAHLPGRPAVGAAGVRRPGAGVGAGHQPAPRGRRPLPGGPRMTGLVTRLRRAQGSGDDGQLVLLVLVYALIAALLVTVVVNVSKVYLNRRSLVAAADGAALSAANQPDLDAVYNGAGSTLPLSPAGTDAPSSSTPRDADLAARFEGFRVVDVTTDGVTVTVTLQAEVGMPFVNLLSERYAAGYPVRAVARARSPLTP